jgi:enolase
MGIAIKAANSIIIKPNQVGTLSQTRETVEEARRAGYITIASHRSGETHDWHLAHISVAFLCPIIKIGIIGGERVAKINELLRLSKLEGMRFAKPTDIGIAE